MALLLAVVTANIWLAYAGVGFGAYFAFKSAWESLRSRSIDVNFLMVFAAAGAVAVGQPADAAALLFLFSLSSTLESLAMAKTRSAIEGLVRLRPSEAILIRSASDPQSAIHSPQSEQRVPVEALQIGDEIRIPPFESIPTDAEVVVGRSPVDQSAMTGESVPVEKGPGDTLLAGTQNLEGSLIASVKARVGDSTLDKIVALVADAQENKASGERVSHWFGQTYTLFVVAGFAVSLLVRLLAIHEPISQSLLASLTLLVALSPCALVISTPATTLSALTWAARNGILVRGGIYIEAAGRVKTVALDKTGTITCGKPRLTEICLCSYAPVAVGAACIEEEKCWRGEGTMSKEALRLLRAAAAAEQYSAHPIAEAILEAAREWKLDVPEAVDQRVAPGLGVRATVDGEPVIIGQLRFLEQEFRPSQEFVEHTKELQARGMTIALISYGGELAALGFQDEPRDDVCEVVQQLRELGIARTEMITGDTEETAKSVAAHAGVDGYRAGLLPDEKVEAVAALGPETMMVGDGVNDAPALARASVGVAMGGLGSDITLNSADVVLMHDKLSRIPELIRLGRRTNRIIAANLIFAAGVIVALTMLSLFFTLPLPIAVVGHEGSTVLVILNGLRLLRGP